MKPRRITFVIIIAIRTAIRQATRAYEHSESIRCNLNPWAVVASFPCSFPAIDRVQTGVFILNTPYLRLIEYLLLDHLLTINEYICYRVGGQIAAHMRKSDSVVSAVTPRFMP
ncbi:hypothetical protein H4582DRAFT_975271 [Lactarius indigo]|nr:hypothetical protein H4582DRAFT_975271 [Lactarius indigo]